MVEKGASKKALKKAFLAAMKKSFGNISASCRAVGIESRQTIYNWKQEDPKFKKAVESEDYAEDLMDAIEAKLAKLGFQDENPTVLIFLAKTKAKSRGYVEKTEIQIDKETVINVGYKTDDSNDNAPIE